MSSHYFTSNEPAKNSELKKVRIQVRGLDFPMMTADSVFSSSGLDSGTKVLLDAVPAPAAAGTFLDLGCGWGPIAAVLATESPEATVWAVDVSERAVDLTARNAARLGLTNVLALTEDQALQKQADDQTTFDLIWSNPPVRIGKKPMQELLLKWISKLNEAGRAYLVINKNLGGDSTAKWLITEGFEVEKIASKKGFRVFCVTNKQSPV